MIRITALNECTELEVPAEDLEVTKEAQETIAISEYYRALSLKQEGNEDFALDLFLALLETQVLIEIAENKESKLFSVKYNCYRNVGLIYESRGDLQQALKYLVEAIDLDDNDVFTQNKIGKLSLKLENFPLSKIAFDKCLAKNPNHWPSKDGLLVSLCQLGAISAAYGWALKCHYEDKNYDRAIRVLLEIQDKFTMNIPYFENTWKMSYKADANCHVKYDPLKSEFPGWKETVKVKDFKDLEIDYEEFKLTELNWLSVGHWIIDLNSYLTQNKYDLCSVFTLDMFTKSSSDEVSQKLEVDSHSDKEELAGSSETPQNGQSDHSGDAIMSDASFVNPNDTDTVNPGLSNEAKQKISGRRRTSDLTHLQQWGWHKNRRSTRKKSVHDPTETEDSSINGFLKRTLGTYFSETYSSASSPFVMDDQENQQGDESHKESLNKSTENVIDCTGFFESSKDSFNTFLEQINNRHFDLIIPIFEFLKYLSIHWNQKMPSELCELYVKIYEIHETFIDYSALHHLSDENFRASYRMVLFYFELFYDKVEDSLKTTEKLEISDSFIKTKGYISFYSGFMYPHPEYNVNVIRLTWLNYCIEKFENNFSEALNYLYKIEELYEKDESHLTIAVELKNVKYNSSINYKTLKDLIEKTERKINLISVKQLYDSGNFHELVDILSSSIIYSTEPKVNVDSLALKIQTQIEVLLESFWNVDRVEDCFIWTERALKYSVDNFVVAPTEYRQNEWASLVNYCLNYIDSIIKKDGCEMILCLGKNMSRLIQTLTQIVTLQLDATTEKNSTQPHLINVFMPWMILHPLFQKEDDRNYMMNKKSKSGSENSNGDVDDVEMMPNWVLMFFTVHDFVGKKQWCCKENGKLLLCALDNILPVLRTPLLENYREIINEHLEQITYCLYGYPAKKARSRHIEEHDAEHIDLNWQRATQLFDLYRPDTLPEFDSFKLASISSEMEQLLLKMVALIPKNLEVQQFTENIKKFINGIDKTLPKEVALLPAQISSIYYLLGDYYFKTQETSKAIRYYVFDLTLKPERFDSWAGLALCKAKKIEIKLNSYGAIVEKDFMDNAENTTRCFYQCLNLKNLDTIWTEFGTFAYNIHSFCSRNLKHSSDTLSMERFAIIEENKDKYLEIASKCFNMVLEAELEATKLAGNSKPDGDDDSHDEQWFYHFMLGKIAEKKKDPPNVYLEHYLKSAKFLYENNATYPIKINHSNPSNLAVEALEVYYRITSAIIKYLENHSKVNKQTGKLFNRVLKELATSPFAFNRAKVNEDNLNALKRKFEKSSPEENTSKQQKIDVPNVKLADEGMDESPADLSDAAKTVETLPEKVLDKNLEKVVDAASRRGSQESGVTTGTTTTSTSSSDSSSTDSDSDSDTTTSDDDGKEEVFIDQDQINAIYKMCIKNLEECVSRFPEHYKAIYRLIFHYLHATGNTSSMDMCKQLLLSSYKTTLGNHIQGLFTERKNNNFFNGIWRIPSLEIDRPGNFTSHMTKCVIILMEVLKKISDHDTLLELALQLQRTPEPDKKYLNDADRKELFQQAITCCTQTFRNKLKDLSAGKKDYEILGLMLDIYQAHRKCIKHLQQKEGLFSAVLIEVYKVYIEFRMTLPETANWFDLAVKMCQQELSHRKNLEKGLAAAQMQTAPPPAAMGHIEVKSVSEINRSVTITASSPSNAKPATTVKPGTSGSARSRGRAPKTATVTTSQSSSGSTTITAIPGMDRSISTSSADLNSLIYSMYSNPLYNQMMQDQSASAMSAVPNAMMNQYMSLFNSLQSTMPSNMGNLANIGNLGMGDLSSSLFAGLLPSTSSSKGGIPKVSQKPSSKAQNTKTATRPSAYELKFLESLKATPFGGLKQNLISNSLSITTTSVSSSLTNTSTTAESLMKNYANMVKMSTSITPTSKKANKPQSKKTTSTINPLSINPLAYSYPKSLNLPPDLPKSLSITPAPAKAVTTLRGLPQKSKKTQDLAKPYKTSKPAHMKPSSSLSITTDKTESMISTYQEFLKNYNSASQQPIQSAVKGMKPTKQKMPAFQQNTIPQRASSNKKLPSLDLAKSISNYGMQKSSQSPSSMMHPRMSQSPYMQNMSGRSSGSICSTPTPPLPGSPLNHTSPTKSLQQKLAERQQQMKNANKKIEAAKSTPSKKSNSDVIVLD